jgi:2Fe-2S ferredoxin
VACRITYVVDGARFAVEAADGLSVMSAARRALVPGVEGKCRGNCSCVTCHVHIHPDWMGAVGRPSLLEESMLDFAQEVQDNSRLACQIPVSSELDGLEVFIPAGQRILGL